MISPLRHFVAAASFCSALVAWTIAATSVEAPVLTPLNPTGIYALGETVGWRVTLPVATAKGKNYTFTVKRNNDTVVASGRIDPAHPATITFTSNEPAMFYAEVAAAGTESRAVAGAAVAPTNLQPSVPRPADFDAFWDSKIKQLEAVPPATVLTPGDSGRPGIDYATIRMANIQGATIYGQLAKPAREGKFPAMLVLQWAGGPYPLQKPWVTDRAAEGWLALNIEPHDVPGDLPAEFYEALPRVIKNYQTLGNTNRDENYFLRMYLGAYRAIDYLTRRSDWNGTVMLAMGTSMGGQQSFAVAGLHPKVTHLITHVPAGADSNGSLHGRNAGYPNWDHRNPKVMETALYFDTVNFAPRIRATSLVSMGFIDTVCPPVGVWIAFNQIAGPKEAVPLVFAAHNHQSTAEQQRAYTDRAAEWTQALVRNGKVSVRPAEKNSRE